MTPFSGGRAPGGLRSPWGDQVVSWGSLDWGLSVTHFTRGLRQRHHMERMTSGIDKRHKLEMPWQTARREYGPMLLATIAVTLLLIALA